MRSGLPCITAKTAAGAGPRARDLDWIIVCPGGLTDAPAVGKSGWRRRRAPVAWFPRAGAATVIAALLDEPGTWHQTHGLVGGDSPVAAAVRSIS